MLLLKRMETGHVANSHSTEIQNRWGWGWGWGAGGEKEGMKGGKKGGREKKGRGKKTEGERGLSDVLVIHFIVHQVYKPPDMFCLAQGTGAGMLHLPHFQSPLRTTSHREILLEGMVERCPVPRPVLFLYDERAYFSPLSLDHYISIKHLQTG